MGQRIALGVVLTAFLAQTGLVLTGPGFVGFFESATLNDATRLMFFELIIALVLASIWMHRDAVATGRRFWPFALVTLVLGSAGPLTYLLIRTFSTSCAVPPRRVKTVTEPRVANQIVKSTVTTNERPSADTGIRLTLRDLLPLVGFVVPTVAMAYASVMPRHGITGMTELTVGFASTVVGASLTYLIGVRAAIRRRAGVAPTRVNLWRRPEWIARQSARPNGLIGWILGHIMRTETAATNNTTARLAAIAPDAQVLDIGCGAGHAVQRVGEQLTTGRVVGLDPSSTMVRLATRRNRRLIALGRATIASGDVNRLAYPDASFDRVLATHTVYFWHDLAHAARELRRVLKPDGLMVLAFGDPEFMRAMFPASVYTVRTATQIAGILATAGFTDTAIETRDIGGHAMSWLLARQRP